jgi:hypothetical protein
MLKPMKYLPALAVAVTATAALAQAQVKTSPHDLSPIGGSVVAAAGQAQSQVCVYCHFPHNATNVGAPLWNRTNSTTAFTMYSSANSATFVLNPTDTNSAARPVGAVSLACLSCHDGQTAFNSLNAGTMFDTDRGTAPSTYTFTSAGAPVARMSDIAPEGVGAGGASSVNLGTDLTNDHPISFTYDNALYLLKGGAANGSLRDPAGTTAAAGTGNLVIYRAGDPANGGVDSIQAQMLFTEGAKTHQLECASCHEPHMHGASGTGAETNATGAFPFLIKSNASSNLCLTCHNK